MKKLILILVLIPALAYSGELPNWVYQSAAKEGEVWRFSGSVHDVSLLNVAVPLARSAALSNLAQSIGVKSRLIQSSALFFCHGVYRHRTLRALWATASIQASTWR